MPFTLSALDNRLELVTGITAISAGFLWLWVVMLEQAGPVICSEAGASGVHCPLCYPALAASLAAVAGAARLMSRRPRG